MENGTNNQPLKIIGLKVDGIRKLQAVEMEFKDKGLIQIKGKNKQGKTSILDTIEFLIKGNKVLNSDIIGHGKESAKAEMTIGNYHIERVIGKTPKLKVKNLETGFMEKGEVQNFLDTFVNELTFNPRPFLDKTPFQQLKFCMDLFHIDFTSIDAQLTTLEQDRLFCGREVKKFGEIEVVPEMKGIDVNKLIAQRTELEGRNKIRRDAYDLEKQNEINKINVFNNEQKDKANNIKALKSEMAQSLQEGERLESEIKELEEKLHGLKKQLQFTESRNQQLELEINGAPVPETEKSISINLPEPDYEATTEIDAAIQEASVNNEKARQYQNHLTKKQEKADKQIEYDSFDSKIKDLRDQKLEILRNTKTGVEGLEIREEGLFYNGNFSENWSDSESIRISSELCLAQMPKLRAIFIDRAESFDSDSLKDLEKWAIENDIEAFVTIVSDIPETLDVDCFYIQEGKIIEKDGE